MTDVDRLIGFMAIMQVPFMNDPDALAYIEEVKTVLKQVKAQEPVAPKLIKMYPHDIYECGNCGHRSVGSNDYKAKFCPECGKAVKWDD